MANTRRKTTVDNKTAETTNTTSTVKQKKDIPLNTLVACTNLTMGKLVYVSKKQVGYSVVWENPGDVDYLELSELVSMRNSQRAFFENNWIGIDDPDVVDYLNVGNYYSEALDFENLSSFMDLSVDEMREKFAHMSQGTKETLKVKVVQMLANKEIDSLKKIDFLKENLGIIADS